ncbi:MAG: M28 family peptidase [bacterium]
MRIHVFIVALLIVSAPFSAYADSRSLVAVNNSSEDVIRQVMDRGIVVVRDLGSYFLAVADKEDMEKLSKLGLDWQLLDSSIDGKTYYTVGVGERVAVDDLARVAKILRFDGAEAVVEAEPEEAEKIAGLGLDIAKVFIRPIRLTIEEKPLQPLLLEADPRIQQMVDAVSQTNISSHVQRLQDFRTRYASHDSCQAAANWIKAGFESYGIDSVFFHHFSSTYKDNVVAVIPGRGNPNKIVVIGGHYDSYTSNPSNCPGADDNATGTACVLECARILSQHEFNYTITLIAFGAEEMGLIGSEAYASEAASRGDDIIAMVAVDMIGYLASGDQMDLDIISNTSSQWIRNLAFDVTGTYVPGFSSVQGSLPSGASSDHASFWAHGYDAVLFFEDTGSYSPYIHTTNDVVGLSYNSPTLAENSVKVAVGLVATLAEPFTIAITHTPLENTEDTQNPYRVVANIVSAEPLNGDSLFVFYSVGQSWNELAMQPTGNPDEYEAYIPAQPGGTWVNYYIFAADSEGHSVVDPNGAPDTSYRFFVGTITTAVFHDFETDQGWTVGAPDDDATTGIWNRCDPQATVAQPEDDHTPDPGVNAYITDCRAGSSQGSYDVDNGKTTLFSPIFDLSSYPNAWVRYYRWYSNDTGAAPETDSWIVDVSNDGGLNWVRLETLGSSDRTWRLVERNIVDYVELTSQIKFRFIASDSDPGSIVEAGLDDFSIVVYEDASSGVGPGKEGQPGIAMLAMSPNPVMDSDVRFTIYSDGARVSLKIYDVSGRLVRTVLQNEKIEGSRDFLWDGRNQSGSKVSEGIYMVRLEGGSRTVTQKIVFLGS